jgi:hypothetical protein
MKNELHSKNALILMGWLRGNQNSCVATNAKLSSVWVACQIKMTYESILES